MNDPRIAEVLQAARERIATPERWTQGALARDRNGLSVRVNGPKATRWSIDGALCRATYAGLHAAYIGAARLLRAAIGDRDTDPWNDAPGRTHAEVLAAFDRAIAAARGDA